MNPSAHVVMDLRDKAHATKRIGILLFAVAGLAWIWFAILLLFPYTAGEHDRDCRARIATERLHNESSVCVTSRDWPKLLGVLALSLPFAVAGSTFYATGAATARIAGTMPIRPPVPTL
ncbi:hypothetical protein SLA_0417 [Streptomyces laurentii]|uniref:Transmembrane protein n=1 Tax=Streptomyces laurentii TaxID=39478 RepID=A0A170RZH6_STRLU|nr:hypothetical protein SLA_0417 [Streptomyces laurentii]